MIISILFGLLSTSKLFVEWSRGSKLLAKSNFQSSHSSNSITESLKMNIKLKITYWSDIEWPLEWGSLRGGGLSVTDDHFFFVVFRKESFHFWWTIAGADALRAVVLFDIVELTKLTWLTLWMNGSSNCNWHTDKTHTNQWDKWDW